MIGYVFYYPIGNDTKISPVINKTLLKNENLLISALKMSTLVVF